VKTGIFGMKSVLTLRWDVTPTPMKAKRMMEASIQTYALAVGAKNPDNGWRLLQFFSGGPGHSRVTP
jgi:hypothetical protein